MSSDEIRVRPETLEIFLTELFGKTGPEESDAIFLARTLVQTNLWGIDSHGVIRVPNFMPSAYRLGRSIQDRK